MRLGARVRGDKLIYRLRAEEAADLRRDKPVFVLVDRAPWGRYMGNPDFNMNTVVMDNPGFKAAWEVYRYHRNADQMDIWSGRLRGGRQPLPSNHGASPGD